MMTKSHSKTNLEQEELTELSELLFQNLDDIITYFDVSKVRKTQIKIYGACPIHNGDKEKSPFNMYLTGDFYRGNWKCRSHNCHLIFKSSLLGFVRGLLSRKEYDWKEKGDKIASFEETIAWSLKWLGKDRNGLKIDKGELEKLRFAKLNSPKIIQQPPKVYISRDMVRAALTFPAKPFVDRGFSEEILDKYDIGLCTSTDYTKEMYDRVVVPIYNDSRSCLVGCTGRSIHGPCDKCHYFHRKENGCPNDYFFQYVKWRHSKTFKAEEYLFNYWFSSEHIKRTSSAVIVESVGNCLKLEQAGIHNSVATFGTHLTEPQQLLLAKLGVLNLIIIPDMDENNAGMQSAELIKQTYNRIYNIHILKDLPLGDVGDMSRENIHSQIIPFLKKHGAY